MMKHIKYDESRMSHKMRHESFIKYDESFIKYEESLIKYDESFIQGGEDS